MYNTATNQSLYKKYQGCASVQAEQISIFYNRKPNKA